MKKRYVFVSNSSSSSFIAQPEEEIPTRNITWEELEDNFEDVYQNKFLKETRSHKSPAILISNEKDYERLIYILDRNDFIWNGGTSLIGITRVHKRYCVQEETNNAYIYLHQNRYVLYLYSEDRLKDYTRIIYKITVKNKESILSDELDHLIEGMLL